MAEGSGKEHGIIQKTFGKTLLLMVLALGLFGVLSAQAQDEPGHILVLPDALEWQSGPGSLPPGAEFILLEGNPSEEGPLTLRLRFPAGYEIPPHYHPALEHVTVLQGVFNFGMGEARDRTQTTAVPVGGFVVVPIEHPHFVWVDEETVIQLHSTGPRKRKG
ncbi:cupin domain-containing protein [soil metagenome]|jgi:quercetin dioxygenase-like cupin family protein